MPQARLVVISGQIWLDVGVMLVERGRRHCHACGHVFHWTRPSNGKTMQLIAAMEQSSGSQPMTD